jgi:uncharacterized protein YegL
MDLPPVNESNPDPRIACALLLDTSWSMKGEPMKKLNEGFELFSEEVEKDELARKRAEIAVITFGGTARVEIPFTEARDLVPRQLSADGSTPMGAALNLACDLLVERKRTYRDADLEYYRPWLFVLTDGAPTDGQVFTVAADRVRQMEKEKGVSVFAIGVGSEADLTKLTELSSERVPVMLDGLSFAEFFRWLSASLSAASWSSAHATDDNALAASGADEMIPLPPPTGWAKA